MNSNPDNLAAPYSDMVARKRAIEKCILEDERSRDLLQWRKKLLTSIYPRPKNSINRRQRSRKSSVLNILTKIALLLAASFYLGQLIWRWTSGPKWDTSSSFAALGYEDRISEVEQSLKITAKMLQVQVEVIKRKIGSEIDIVTGELQKYVEEMGELIEKELKKLESRTDDLVFSLVGLENCGLLTKEELMSKQNLGDMGEDVVLNEIITLTRETVEKEIEKHAADGIGRVDYALGSGGAKVLRHSDPYVYGKAHKILEPSAGEPGQCFPLRGSSGFVEIRLREGIIPEAITLEHVSKRVAYDRSSAPKDCRVSGWLEPPEDVVSAKTIKRFALTNFSYDLEKSNVQTFTIPMVGSGIIINIVRLDFTSNHGSSSFTCIYRIRVHGYVHGSPVSHGHMSSSYRELEAARVRA